MPASHPIWLRLRFASISVQLYTATKANAKPRFRHIHGAIPAEKAS